MSSASVRHGSVNFPRGTREASSANLPPSLSHCIGARNKRLLYKDAEISGWHVTAVNVTFSVRRGSPSHGA